MPTDLTKVPFILDAADVGGLPRTIFGRLARWSSEGYPQTVAQWVTLGQVTWYSPAATAGDMVIFTDLNGHEVVRLGPASGAQFEDQIKLTDTMHFEGLILTALPSGIVRLEYR